MDSWTIENSKDALASIGNIEAFGKINVEGFARWVTANAAININPYTRDFARSAWEVATDDLLAFAPTNELFDDWIANCRPLLFCMHDSSSSKRQNMQKGHCRLVEQSKFCRAAQTEVRIAYTQLQLLIVSSAA